MGVLRVRKASLPFPPTLTLHGELRLIPRRPLQICFKLAGTVCFFFFFPISSEACPLPSCYGAFVLDSIVLLWHGVADARSRVLRTVEMKGNNHVYRSSDNFFKMGKTFDVSA